MSVYKEDAHYVEKEAIFEFIGNPLIAALSGSYSQPDLLRKLTKLPLVQEKDRSADSSDRLNMLTRISAIHIPQVSDLYIARSLYRCICGGYVSRNPVPFSITRQVLEEHNVDVTEDLENYLTRTVFPVYGFSVLGISGVGKTCSVLNALNIYPKVIQHTEYHGYLFKRAQLVWLKVDCPGDGTAKGLCSAILQQIDATLGTTYHSEVTNRISKDVLISKVSSCLKEHYLGVLVIDDIQNLVSAKNEATTDMLSFLIFLMETLDIPVVMVATPKVIPFFQREFQLAKRATGDGTVRMELLEENSKEWDRFITTIWGYLYTKQPVPLTSEMNHVFFEESVGNPFLCSLLFKLLQDDAITSRRESFSIDDVKKVAHDKLCITTRMRKNMLAGTDEELRRYEYLWNTVQMPILENVEEKPPKPKEAGRETQIASQIASKLVMTFGIQANQAMKLAQESIAAMGFENEAEIEGYAIKLCKVALDAQKERNNET